MLKSIISAICLLCFISLGSAQHVHERGKCGTVANEEFKERIQANKKYIAESNKSLETIYLPIKFHRVGKTTGEEKVNITSILDMMCRLKREYAKYDIIPYIKDGFGDVNSSGILLDPIGNESQIVQNKSGNAIDIFITENASTGNVPGDGTTLGYYAPPFGSQERDYIVVRKKEVIDSTETLEHEIGHYLSLDHTFSGWEGVQYSEQVHGNPLEISSVGGTAIELVSRNGNCETAGDQLCDTPADYNFSFSIVDTDDDPNNNIASGCTIIKDIKDSDGAVVAPDVRNIMSYYSCSGKYFSESQIELMNADFNSPARDFLRTAYIPNLEEITETPTIISPSSSVDTYNSVSFEWTAVENADHYVLEISSSTTSQSYVTTEPKAFITDLNPNEVYFWVVAPFNETSTCIRTSPKVLQTGDIFSSVEDLSAVADIQIFPNPVNNGETIQVRINSSEAFKADFSLLSLDGKTVFERKDTQINTNTNSIEINTNNIAAGMYLLHVKSSAGLYSKQIVIK